MKSTLKLMKHSAWFIGELFKIDKYRMVLFSLLIIFSRVFTSIILYVNRVTIDELNRIRLINNITFVILLFLTTAIIMSMNEIADRIAQAIYQKMQWTIGVILRTSLAKKTNTISVLNFEKLYFNKRFKKASYVPYGAGITVANMVLLFMGELVNAIVISTMLIQFSMMAFIIIMVFAVPYFILQFVLTKKQYDEDDKLVGFQFKAEYIVSLLTKQKNVNEIRVYGIAEKLISRYGKLIKNIQSAKHRELFWKELFTTVLSCVNSIIKIILLVLLCYVSQKTKGSLGSIIMAWNALAIIQLKLKFMSETLAGLQFSAMYIRDYKKIMNEESIGEVAGKPVSAEDSAALVTLKDVYFAYRKNRFALKNISLKIDKGEKVAIVGDNGSGKSTLIKIILGLYRPTKGELVYNDYSGSSIEGNGNSAYGNYSAVFQDFSKFPLKVSENIVVGDPSLINKDILISALEKAGLGYLIPSLPKGFETVLSKEYDNDGLELSGGEWQKLAISRAFVSDRDIFVMDEPTASIDPISEINLMESLLEKVKDKTCILISHRIGFARFANRIIVMREGCIVEDGTHEELISKRGEYYNLFHQQSKWYDVKQEVR